MDWQNAVFTVGTVIVGSAIFYMADIDVLADWVNQKLKSMMEG